MRPITEFGPIGLRRDRLVGLMSERGLDGLLATSPENVYYLTGYTTLPTAGNPILYQLRNRLPFFAYVGHDGRTTLMCWLLASLGLEFGVDDVIGFTDHAAALDALATFMRKRSDGNLGIESSCPYEVLQVLQSAGREPGSLAVADDVLTRLRTVKTDTEVGHLRSSLAAVERTLEELYGLLRPGIGRIELIQEAKSRLFRNEATGIGHATISFGTANPEIAIDEKLEPDHLITLDVGAVYEGYAADTRRYAFSGQIPSELAEHHSRMVEVVDGVGEALRPGSAYADVYRRAVQLLVHHTGSQPTWLTHVGHHIGLETEEEWITDRPDAFIEPGMVINVELYSLAPSGHHVGDEETFVVGTAGAERISRMPRGIRAV